MKSFSSDPNRESGNGENENKQLNIFEESAVVGELDILIPRKIVPYKIKFREARYHGKNMIVLFTG